MKKLKNLTFACLLILGLAACADDDKSSNPPSYDDPTIIINDSHTAKIGGTAEKTITFTNPFASSAELDVYFNNYNSYNSSITIDKTKSTCNFRTNTGGTTSNDISHTLQASESCTLVYSFAPTKLDTELLKLSVDYRADIKTICPTPDTVPTYEQVRNSSRYEEWYIYNYAEDSNGNKSPEFINVDINTEWAVSGYTTNYTNTNTTDATFNLPAKQGTYNYYLLPNMELISNDNNCSVSANKLTVNDNNIVCSLTLKNSVSTTIQFIPTIDTNPYYNVNVDVNSDYTYSILYPQYAGNTPTFYPEYYISNLSGNTYFYVALLTNNEKITSYERTGTNKDKFKVAPTKHNGCTVTDKEISIPAGQENCFFTVEIADITESGDFTATLNTTLSTGSTNTYNIKGTVSLLTIQDMLQNYCKENTQSNQTYKLF